MDESGWISLSVITNFNRVRQIIGLSSSLLAASPSSLDRNTQLSLILDTLKKSSTIEVNNADYYKESVSDTDITNSIYKCKIRRRGDWKQWLLPSNASTHNSNSNNTNTINRTFYENS